MKYRVAILLLLVACKSGSHTSLKTLSIIVFSDSVVVYSGPLNAKTKIESITLNEKNIKELIGAETKKTKEELKVLIKPAWFANAGGNAQDILTWCKKTDLKKISIASIDTDEESFFKITGPKITDDGDIAATPLKLHLPAKEADPTTVKTTAETYSVLLLKNDMVYLYQGYDIGNKVFYGKLQDALFRSVLVTGKKKIGKNYFVALKPTAGATYRNTVDILDEMLIDDIKKYAMVSISDDEINFIENLQRTI